MKNTLYQAIFFFVLISFIPLYAEDNKLRKDPLLQIIKPSQEAQSLGKFSEIPVDLYTGRTNINIPLLTISHNGIEVPISLSYHGGGIKVDDKCGLVGLGWTLNAGGVVNRIVRGMPDDLNGPINGLVRGYNHLKQEERNFIDILMHRTRPENPMALLDSVNQLYLMKRYGQEYDENKIDVAPDNYIFQVHGMSGAFVADTYGNPQYVQSSGGSKIRRGAGKNYVLTDLNGHEYTFANYEEKIFPYRVENYDAPIQEEFQVEYTDWYLSAWWLSSIVSTAGDSITFEYSTEKQIPPHNSFYTHTQYVTLDAYGGFDYRSKNYNGYSDPYLTIGSDTLKRQLLSSIQTPYCLLQFYYSNTPYAYSRLDSISLRVKEGTRLGDTIESFKLVYTDSTNKAKLSKLIHWGRNNKSQVYHFAYHTTGVGIGHENVDHWGYFSANSKGRFANKNYFNLILFGVSTIPTSERHTDKTNAINNMLKSITYPSGLTTEFTWEPHDFSKLSYIGAKADSMYTYKEYDYSNPTPEMSYAGGVRIKYIKYNDNNKELLTKEYTYIDDSTGQSSGILSYPPRYANTYPMLTTIYQYNYPSEIRCVPLLILRSQGLPYTHNGGGHVEYKQVTECTISNSDNPRIAKVNRIDYYFSTSETKDASDIDETQHDTLISADMLQLTSMRHRRGDLIKKVEYTDGYNETTYNYQIIEPDSVPQISGCLFPIADYQDYPFGLTYQNTSLHPYKNFGIVKYRIIPYNKRLTGKTTISNKVTTCDTYTYSFNTYQNYANADLPKTHSYLDSEDNWCTEDFTYWLGTNKIKKYVAIKNNKVIDAYQLTYDDLGRVIHKEVALLSSDSATSISQIQWDSLETYTYYSEINKIQEIFNHRTNITTTYLWSYGGAYPIAEITDATKEEVQSALDVDIKDIIESQEPNISEIDKLRGRLTTAQIKTMTYAPLIGITSYTDAKGYTQYYEYDDFGHIREIYEKVNNNKHIIKSFEYQLQNQK